jgi:subtilisin family serine protease
MKLRLLSFLPRVVPPLLVLVLAVPGAVLAASKAHGAAQPKVEYKVIPGAYIVQFNEVVPKAEVSNAARDLTSRYGGSITYVYDSVLHGYAVNGMSKKNASALARDPRVKLVEPDVMGQFAGAQSHPRELFPPSQPGGAFFGVPKPLDRIDQRSSSLDQVYIYPRTGLGVHVYVVDTGIDTKHNSFGGRAYPLWDFQPPIFGNHRKYSEANGRGYAEPSLPSGSSIDIHGTAVAGTIGSRDWGVCKNCLLYSVRAGSSLIAPNGLMQSNITASAFIEAIGKVIADVNANTRRPAVINASLTFATSNPSVGSIEQAVRDAMNNNILVVTGSGNDSGTTTGRTPQRMTEPLVVGATVGSDPNPNPDTKAAYANTGSSVDVWAPAGDFSKPLGDGNIAHWRPRMPQSHTTYGADGWVGTSFASPLGAGVAALYLEAFPNTSAANVAIAIKNNASFPGFPAPGGILYAGCQFIPPPTTNPIDDTTTFVRQHYIDFLGRSPDASGLAFWVNNIEQCGANAGCREVQRINTSRAFFESIEFQETGGFVYRLNRMSFTSYVDDHNERNTIQPRMERFFYDQRKVGEGFQHLVTPDSVLDNNKDSFVVEWFNRPRFQAVFGGLGDDAFVNLLYQNAGVTDEATRLNAISALANHTKTRPQVLRTIAESQAMRDRFFAEQYVLMQYFGYLRRNPDDPQDINYDGFLGWLHDLQTGTKTTFDMANAFISSIEYRGRFLQGPVFHPTDCPQGGDSSGGSGGAGPGLPPPTDPGGDQPLGTKNW